MRTRKIVFLLTMCAVLVGLAIIGSSSWLIVNREQKQPTYPTKADTSIYFTTGGTYNGSFFTPSLNNDGLAVFGSDAQFEITYLGGTPEYSGYYNGTFAAGVDCGSEAGTHRYKIVDKTTGQIIANNHIVTVSKASVTASAAIDTVTNKGAANANLKTLGAGFVGDTVAWKITVKGLSVDGTLGTGSASYVIKATDFDTYSANVQDAGNKYTASFAVTSTVTDNAKHKNNYNFTGSCSYSCGVLPTCFASAGGARTYYANLDQALADTQGKNVTVVPPISITAGNYTFNVKNNFTHNITKNATIGPNVKLFIPYDTSEAAVTAPAQITGTSATAFGVAAKKINEVTVAQDVTVTANGSIHIPGQVTGSQNGQNGASLTTGLHSQLTLGKNAKIDAYNDVHCYGFIAESSYNNGSEIKMNSGEITTVYSVIEHRGGTIFLGMIGGINKVNNPEIQTSPFNRFFIRSVTSALRITDKSSLVGYADLYANDAHNTTYIDFAGNSSSSFIQVLNGSEMVLRYDTSKNQNVMSVYGNANFNSIALTVTAMGKTVTLSTENVLFPLSHYWDVSFNRYANGAPATVNAPSQNIKVLPGASLTIGADVTFNIGTMVVYPAQTTSENYYTKLQALTEGGVCAYPYTVTTAGNLYVAGSLNVANFGGLVHPVASGAVINITTGNSATVTELSSTDSSGFAKLSGATCKYDFVVNPTANGTQAIKSGNSVSSSSGNLAVGMYVGYNFVGTTNYGWMDSDTEFNLVYSFVGADGYTVTNTNQATYKLLETISLSVPTVSGTTPQFAGWFPNAELNADEQIFSITGAELLALHNGDAILYGKWTPTAHTVAFNTSTNIGNLDANSVAIPSINVESGKTFNPYTNTQINAIVDAYYDNMSINRYFEGWYTDSSFTNRVSESTGVTVTADMTLYAKWVTKATIKFSIPSTAGYTVSDIYIVKGSPFNPYVYDVQANVYSGNYEFQYYFEGWYVNGSRIDNDDYVVNSDVTFTASWLTKVKLIFDMGVSGLTNPYLWFAPGTLLNVSYLDVGVTAKDSDIGFQYYFDAWYSDSALTAIIDGEIAIADSGDGTMTVYSKWNKKYKVIISESQVDSPYDKGFTVNVHDQETTLTSFYVMPNATMSVTGTCAGKRSSSWGTITYAKCQVTVTDGTTTIIGDPAEKSSGFIVATQNEAAATLDVTVTSDVTITITYDGSV